MKLILPFLTTQKVWKTIVSIPEMNNIPATITDVGKTDNRNHERISFAIPVLCMVLFGCHQKNESRIYMSNDSCFQVISFNPDYHYTNLRFFNLSKSLIPWNISPCKPMRKLPWEK